MKFNWIKNIKERVCNWINNKKPVKLKTLSIFTRELAILYQSGIPLHKSLEIVLRQTSHIKLKKALEDIYLQIIKRGSSFSSALAKQSEVFPFDYTSMIYLGEKSGTLHKILKKLANLSEKECDFKQKIKAKITYPLIATIIAFLSIILIIKYIFPSFIPLFLSFEVNLPMSTKFLILASKILNNPSYLIITLGIVSLGSYQLNCYIKTPAGKSQFDILKTKLPVASDIFKKLTLIRFCQSLLLLYGSGISLIKSLETIEKIIHCTLFKSTITCVINQIKAGRSFSEALKKHKIFPPMAINLIASGEESCQLEKMLDKISFYYNSEIEYISNKIQTLLAPVILVILGVIVGFIFIAIFSPLYDIVTGLGI